MCLFDVWLCECVLSHHLLTCVYLCIGQFLPQTLKQSTFLSLFCCESNGRYKFLCCWWCWCFANTSSEQPKIICQTRIFSPIPFQRVIIGCYRQVKFFSCFLKFVSFSSWRVGCSFACPFISFDSRRRRHRRFLIRLLCLNEGAKNKLQKKTFVQNRSNKTLYSTKWK